MTIDFGFVPPFIVALAASIFGFFFLRLIKALDKCTDVISQLSTRLDRFEHMLDGLSKHTSTEIEALKDRLVRSEEEILSLRESRHENGTAIQKIGFKYELLDREFRVLASNRAEGLTS